MATIDLGKIKLVNRGAYNNSTAYTVDDLVQSGGSTYICIQNSTGNAVTNGSYWSVLAAGGTDVGTTLTTQGDILYRDGSGLQRLAKGTAGQVLKINSGATAPEWGTDQGGKILQVKQASDNTQRTTSSNSFVTASNTLSVTITPTAASSKILVQVSTSGYGDTGSNWFAVTIYKDGSNLNTNGFASWYTGGHDNGAPIAMQYYDAGGDTNAHTYQVYMKANAGNVYLNSNSGNYGQMIVWEIAG